MKKRAVYPGTFDPVTNGHIDLIKRSLSIFDELIVAVVETTSKSTMFDIEERVYFIKEAIKNLKNVRVEAFDGLLVEYAKENKCQVIVRGLRAVADFEYEFQMALMNRKLANTIDMIYLMPSEIYTYISSTIIKEVASLGGDISPFVPAIVEKALKNKYRQ